MWYVGVIESVLGNDWIEFCLTFNGRFEVESLTGKQESNKNDEE